MVEKKETNKVEIPIFQTTVKKWFGIFNWHEYIYHTVSFAADLMYSIIIYNSNVIIIWDDK